MIVRNALFALAAVAVASPAAAAVSVIGNSLARICFVAAENRLRPASSDIAECDGALETEGLTQADRVATHVNRGILKLRLRRIDAAIADFDRAIALDPAEAEAYLNKGMAALHQDGGWQTALGLFDTALARETSRPEVAYYGRGVANEMGGRVAAAYRDYRQASTLAPQWQDPQKELARFTVRQP